MEDLFKSVNPLVLQKAESEEAYIEYFKLFDSQLLWYAEASEMAKASLNAAARVAKKREAAVGA